MFGFFSPRFVGDAGAGAFRGLLTQTAVGAMGRGRLTMKAALSSVVEVIGLEPTTPCLQSRCSPS